jgi:serine/threonine protein phosphatase 1
MATIAIGDIHGNLPALADVLVQVGSEVRAGDSIVFLGDYIDRGPDSRGCVDAILEFGEHCVADVVCLLGNHEDWMLRTRADYSRHSWLLGMQPFETIRSYSADAERMLRDAIGGAGLNLYLGKCELPYGVFFDAMPESHRAFFSSLALCLETADCICVHAGLDPDVPALADQTFEWLVWSKADFQDTYRGEVPVVYGHWNNADIDAAGWPHPRIIGNTIGVDTSRHGVLTAIRLPDRRVFQSARHAAAEPQCG